MAGSKLGLAIARHRVRPTLSTQAFPAADPELILFSPAMSYGKGSGVKGSTIRRRNAMTEGAWRNKDLACGSQNLSFQKEFFGKIRR